MNRMKKAELQRKLSRPHVPNPPADLGERLKNDIARYLQPENERQRLSRSIAFNLRVAASVIFLVSSVYFFMAVLSREKGESVAVTDVTSSVTPAAAPSPSEMERARTEMFADQLQANTEESPAAAPLRAATNAAPVPTVRRRAETLVAEAEPPPLPLPAPPPPPAAAPPPVVADVAEGVAVAEVAAAPAREEMGVAGGRIAATQASAPAAADSAAARMDAGERKETLGFAEPRRRDIVFGVSIDPDAFPRVKAAIARGEQPAAGSVDIEALINYFAGTSPRRINTVNMDAEGSPAPLGNSELCCVLRVSIDTAAAPGPESAIGNNARIEVELNSRVVRHHRRVGSDAPLRSSESLRKNLALTVLYEVDVEAASERDWVAKVKLYYRKADGRAETIQRIVYGREFTRPWKYATTRHRLASLGAVWGETLRGTGSGPDVAEFAQQLASEQPSEARARELAEAASASSRLRVPSTPTGSGR